MSAPVAIDSLRFPRSAADLAVERLDVVKTLPLSWCLTALAVDWLMLLVAMVVLMAISCYAKGRVARVLAAPLVDIDC